MTAKPKTVSWGIRVDADVADIVERLIEHNGGKPSKSRVMADMLKLMLCGYESGHEYIVRGLRDMGLLFYAFSRDEIDGITPPPEEIHEAITEWTKLREEVNETLDMTRSRGASLKKLEDNLNRREVILNKRESLMASQEYKFAEKLDKYKIWALEEIEREGKKIIEKMLETLSEVDKN